MASSPIFVKRPVSGCLIAFAVVPGALTGIGLLLGAWRAELPWVARIALGGLGALFLLATTSLLLGSSGVLVDQAARTITPVFRWAWIEKQITPVRVEAGDRLVVETGAVPSARHPALAHSALLVRGPSGDRFVLGTRSQEEAERSGRAIAALLGLE